MPHLVVVESRSRRSRRLVCGGTGRVCRSGPDDDEVVAPQDLRSARDIALSISL
ncbi:hypothetical protein GJR88_01715 [Dietzia sp. DQ12-45-1b]|nr:hypothetical protein GJR88_01715 [Dietzia sp. DQ12-45-1b]